jgi:hypothetical protein
MEKIEKILLFGIISLLLIILAISFNNTQPSLSPNPEISECYILEENGNPETKINIVFLAHNIENIESLTQEYIDLIQNTKPFSDHKEKFNFYYIEEKADCSLLNNEAIFCSNRYNRILASSCPNEYIVVLSSQPAPIRSSAHTNIASINTNTPKTVFLHEFGHIFGNLADEYHPSILLKGQENCFESCNAWQAEIENCYEGCSKSNYYRSSKKSIMRSLYSNTYGGLNKLIIEKLLNKYN